MATRFDRWALGVGLILLLVASSASGINATWFTRVWQTDDGLLDNNIAAIVQSQDDYLWVVTPVGLMRFDGVSFSPFPIEDFFTGLTAPHVRIVLCSRTGVLWMASDGGTVFGLNPDFSAAPFPQSGLPKHVPRAMAEDGDGSLWLGYASAIYRVKDEQVT